MGGDLKTLGRLAAESGASYLALRQAAADVPPVLRLNGTPYYDADGVARLLMHAQPAEAHRERQEAGQR